jgi:hypothetical protein
LFKREHHLRIATILESLDADFLRRNHCLFGGGTAIALTHEEYRESVDVDFVVSDPGGYRILRDTVRGKGGWQNLARKGAKLNALREVRADQYGIRTLLSAGGSEIKFEIVFEARISLTPPAPKHRICGVSTLTTLDMAATKLLANSDRWADDSVFSRDVIDLAMLEPSRRTLTDAIEKAGKAYGKSIERDLGEAIQALKGRTGRLEECMSALKMDEMPEALVWKKIRALKSKIPESPSDPI